MRIATAFSGIGSPEQALKRLNIDHEIVFACEIDRFARQSYKANYEIKDEHFHCDIHKLDGTQYKDIDLFVWGFPCQDYSLAGKRVGLEGQRGTLFYEGARIVKETQPKYFIAENVKGLLSSNDGKDFETIMDILRHDIGYYCTYAVLNTKDYGVPQNRERIFILGFQDYNEYISYQFPDKIKLEKRLKDSLEEEVHEKYYLSDKMITYLDHAPRATTKGDEKTKIAPCLAAVYYKTPTDGFYLKVNSATKKGYETAKQGDSINLSVPNSKTRRGRVGKGVAQTLDTACNQAVIEPIEKIMNWYKKEDKSLEIGDIIQTGQTNMKGQRIYKDGINPTLPAENPRVCSVVNDYKIRKLTPKECFRLQGFPDHFHDKCKDDGVSDSQRYKQAGNSITVDVMMALIKSITEPKKESLF